MVYVCDKCNKSFDHKGHYVNHIKRKTSCSGSKKDINNLNKTINSSILNKEEIIIANNKEPIDILTNIVETNIVETNYNIQCPHCKKSFSRKYTLDRHIEETCKLKNNNNIINNDKIKLMEETMNRLIEENKELKSDVTKLKVKKITNHYSNNIMNIGSINTINTINNNFILKFGREDVYKLNDEDKYKILFEKGLDPILESIERTHFNTSIPDQQNIYLKNINSKYVNLYNGKTWEKNKLDSATDTLLENHAYNLGLMVDECDEHKKPKIKKSVNKSIQMVNDYFKLENDDLICTDEKSRKEKEITIRNQITELKENVKLKLYNKTQEIQGQHKEHKYLVV